MFDYGIEPQPMSWQERCVKKYLWPLITSLMFLTSCAGRYDHEVAKNIIAHEVQSTPVPPGFLGHPLAYAGAVFSQLIVFSFSMMIIFFVLRGMDYRRDGCHINGSYSWQSPVNVYRTSILLFMLGTALASSGNLLVYLSWNEVVPSTLAVFFTIEKLTKFFVIAPFLSAIYLLAKNDEVVTMQLAFHACYEPLWPEETANRLRQYGFTIVLVMILAIGVTYAKWSGVR